MFSFSVITQRVSLKVVPDQTPTDGPSAPGSTSSCVPEPQSSKSSYINIKSNNKRKKVTLFVLKPFFWGGLHFDHQKWMDFTPGTGPGLFRREYKSLGLLGRWLGREYK